MTDHETLVGMGFDPALVSQALKKTGSLNNAMDWLVANPNGEAVDLTAVQDIQNEHDQEVVVETANSLRCDDCQKLLKDSTMAEYHASKTGHSNFSESTLAIKPLTPEEKAQKLLQLQERMKQRKLEKELAEKEELKNKEKVKRATQAEINALREKHELMEMNKQVELKKREKEEDRLYKEKIRKQLEQDKLERKQRASGVSAETVTAKKEKVEPAVAADYQVSRVQIRTSKGPFTNQFKVDDTLQDVVEFLKGKGFREPFKLSMNFPRKVFDESEYGKTLNELKLVPSCALILQ